MSGQGYGELEPGSAVASLCQGGPRVMQGPRPVP